MKSYLKFLCFLIAGMTSFWVIPFQDGTSGIRALANDFEVKGPQVSKPVPPGISHEVRTLTIKEQRKPGDPLYEFPRQRYDFDSGVSGREPLVIDALMQPYDEQKLPRAPNPVLSFEGMSLQNGGDGEPPDTIGDVGPNHYVQMVNSSFTVFDKNGNRLSGPTSINQLWQAEGNACERCNDGDPVVLYDPLADRWLLSQFAVCEDPLYYECIAISKTADPTGEYYLYAFEITEFPDYPKLGVWPDAYYMTTNDDNGAYAFDRDRMLSGQSATYQRFDSPGNIKLPSDLDGSTPPPSGSPNYFYTMKTGNILEIWEFHVDFTTPSNSTFTLAQTLTTSPFNYDLCGFSWDCIPQKGTTQKLDAISEWPMWRLQYRNFTTHETLVGNFTVDVADFSNHAGIRWFELRKTDGGVWSIHQEGTHAPDGHHRWMGSIAMDGNGNIALGYSVSSDTLFPSIRYATQGASDPLGVLNSEVTLISGSAPQTSSNRWGDYSAMNVDPSDDATFWYTNEYLADSTLGWQTRIGTFTFVASPPTVSSTNPAQAGTQVAVSANISATFSKTMDGTTLTTSTFTLADGSGNTVSGSVAYTGTTATFNPTQDLAGGKTYTATITTGAKDISGSSLESDYTWTFTTAATPPAVNTTAISSITTTSASSGGNVTTDGGASVTSRGVCWSISANPTVSDNFTTDGTGTGSFTSAITGLSPDTGYHVRAYATNSVGTSYGSDLTFTTSPAPSGGGGGCFIATAAFGSPLQPHVRILREFRDRFLFGNLPGKMFIDVYYAYSPSIADWIAPHRNMKRMVRLSLLPIVGGCWVILKLGPVYCGILIFLSGLIMMGVFALYRYRHPK